MMSNKNDESSVVSQGMQFMQTNENQSVRDVQGDGQLSQYSVAQYNSHYQKIKERENNYNFMLNSVIDENISDEKTEYDQEFLADYMSGHNHKAQSDLEGKVNQIGGSYVLGCSMNINNIKHSFQSKTKLQNEEHNRNTMIDKYNDEGSEEKFYAESGKRRETVLPPGKNPLLRNGSDATSGSNENVIMRLKNSDHESMQSVDKRLSREYVKQLQMLVARQEQQPHKLGYNNGQLKNEKKSDISMVDRNSLFSKSS